MSTGTGIKKNMVLLENIAWLPAVCTIVFIFYMTTQNGDVSDSVSMDMAGRLSDRTYFGVSLTTLNSILRTMAHFAEYASLSLFIGFAVTVNRIRGKMRFFYMCLMAMIVAVTDEFVQIFVPGRYGDIRDLFFDGMGILIVALILLAFSRPYKNTDVTDKRAMLGINIDNVTFEEAVRRICTMAGMKDRSRYIVTPNVDHIIKLQKDEVFRKVYDKADLIVTDGVPLMWIAESTGQPIREKISGSDLLPRVAEKAAEQGLSVFLFGAEEGIADKAADNLKAKYEKLKIAGTYSPPLGFENDSKELEKSIEIINKGAADIVVLGLGSPKQEKFILDNIDRLHPAIYLPIGAAIDFEAGHISRAPLWMRSHGLEWFYRFVNEPGRLFKRYFIDDLKIFMITWKYRNC